MLVFTSYERLKISGQLKAESFIPWIKGHAARLGLDGAILHTSDQLVEIRVSGPMDMIDAMEMGCLLGPIDVWVDAIERTSDPSGR